MEEKQRFTLPTILTLIRLIVSPLMLPVLLVYLLPLNVFFINSLLALLFVAFSVTDFLDGYLARRLKQETVIGSMLDPIADKFLVYSTLVSLLAVGKIYFYWVIILIGREFFVMGLRQISLENSFSVNVSWLGKIKTFIQMTFLTFVIINPHYHEGLLGSYVWNSIQLLLLLATLVMSVFSAWLYYREFIREFRARNRKETVTTNN